jgi:hypothetical protein
VDARQLRLLHHVGQGFKVSQHIILHHYMSSYTVFGMFYFPSLYAYLYRLKGKQIKMKATLCDVIIKYLCTIPFCTTELSCEALHLTNYVKKGVAAT